MQRGAWSLCSCETARGCGACGGGPSAGTRGRSVVSCSGDGAEWGVGVAGGRRARLIRRRRGRRASLTRRSTADRASRVRRTLHAHCHRFQITKTFVQSKHNIYTPRPLRRARGVFRRPNRQQSRGCHCQWIVFRCRRSRLLLRVATSFWEFVLL